MKEVYDFLKESGTYYLATLDQNQPRVRPFGTVNIYDDKLYIQTGKSKDVSKQIGINPRIEICAMNAGKWIRVEATLINDDNKDAKQSMLDAYPMLKDNYKAEDDNTQVLFLTDVTATIEGFDGEKQVINF